MLGSLGFVNDLVYSKPVFVTPGGGWAMLELTDALFQSHFFGVSIEPKQA
jgi:hypothetical protein